jgi:hypothetical protein
MRAFLLCSFFFLFAFGHCSAQKLRGDSIRSQVSDTLSKVKKARNPKTASLLSMVLPGAGQVYNRKYWKLPILYGGAFLLGHYIKLNNEQYQLFRNSYIQVKAGEKDYFNGAYNPEQLARLREYWRRNRDFLVVISSVTYLMNIVDAAVDAHLSQFDVSDNLSMRIEPGLMPVGNRMAAVVGLRFDIH